MDMLNKVNESVQDYVSVTEIGKKLSEFLGTNKNITGQKVNEAFCKLSFQKVVNTADVKYFPCARYEHLVEKIMLQRIDKDYNFYFKWHKSIILMLLDISLNESKEQNIVKIIKRLQYIKIVDLNEVDYKKLENGLAKILN